MPLTDISLKETFKIDLIVAHGLQCSVVPTSVASCVTSAEFEIKKRLFRIEGRRDIERKTTGSSVEK